MEPSENEYEAYWEEPPYLSKYPGETKYIKRPFLKMESNQASRYALYQEVSRRTGINPSRVAELVDGKVKLTEQEFAVFKRAPASMLPDIEVIKRRESVLDKLAELDPGDRTHPEELPTYYGRSKGSYVIWISY
jgi:hypothetical protein